MLYKLIALDLDGTLLREDLTISHRALEALERAKRRGIALTLASGRGYPSMRRWVQELGIVTPVIGYQGAVIVDPETDQRVYQRTFSRSLVGELRDFARENDLSLTLYVDDEIYVENKRHSDAFYSKWFGLPCHLVGDLSVSVAGEPTKFIIIGSEGELDRIRPAVERRLGNRLQIMRSHRYFLEGLALGVSKGRALAWLAERLGVAREETMAIGDSGNDREMVAWAGLGVAMGNASTEVKAVADHVAPAIDEDGVAEAIERFCMSS